MPALVVQVATDVKTVIGDASLSQSVTAQRGYRPEVDLKNLGTAFVTVIPATFTNTIETRSKNTKIIAVDVAVQKRIDTTSNTDADAMALLTEEISDLFDKGLQLATSEAWWIEVGNDPIFEPDHFKQESVFTSVLRFTFRKVI